MTEITDLLHEMVSLPGGGMVLALNTGATIGPESQAMLGALYSRSPGSVLQHLETIREKGAAHFMSQFYVGYGHKSIGDLGDACVFIEGVSMLAAKAIQDFPLYNGQEVSTRYVDFTKQPFINPAGTEEGNQILENWRRLNLEAVDVMVPYLKEQFPRSEGDSVATYEKAIKARAFDTARAYLPAGASTNLVWVGPLRQFGDRLSILRTHPLGEVRTIGLAIEKALLATYPNSFSKEKDAETGAYIPKHYEATDTYNELWQRELAYFDPPDFFDEGLRFRMNLNLAYLESEFGVALRTRPPKAELPYRIRDCGNMETTFLLDFGSFRDLQRHRPISLPMPLLTAKYGFEEWYLDELPDSFREKVEKVLQTQLELIEKLGLPSKEVTQYYLPMGYRVPIRIIGDLRAMVYLVELRATRFVHPTLRYNMSDVSIILLNHLGKYGLVLHLDAEPDQFDARRGEHDIIMKT